MKTTSLEAIGLSLALATGCASSTSQIKPTDEPQCPQGMHPLVDGEQKGCAQNLDVCIEGTEIDYMKAQCAIHSKCATVVEKAGIPTWVCEK